MKNLDCNSTRPPRHKRHADGRCLRPYACGPQLLPLRVMSGSAHLTPYGVHATQHWTPDLWRSDNRQG